MTAPSVPSAEDFKDVFVKRLSLADDLHSALIFRSDAQSCRVRLAGSAEWTNALLNIVLQIGADLGFHVYPRRKYFARMSKGTNCDFDRPQRRRDDCGEWLVDASWTRYPSPDSWVQSLRKEPQTVSRGLVLACESEWGEGPFGARATPETHVSSVLDDFAKLVDLRAPLKVMFFGFLTDTQNGIAGFKDIATLCGKVAAPVEPTERYLLFGWPYYAAWNERMTSLAMETF